MRGRWFGARWTGAQEGTLANHTFGMLPYLVLFVCGALRPCAVHAAAHVKQQ